jgi:glyoxylase-like metal-dependent hydrolase (beta-lactamase superfamily II)
MQRPFGIAEGLESFAARTPTLPPATHTQSYALGARDVLLVEPATPYDDERREWMAWANGLASRGRRLVGILLTHHHADHAGGAVFFARTLGLPLWAHALTRDRVPDASIGRELADGDVIVLDGPTPERWEVLHTPGHAPGHVCVYERSRRFLVAGDMVASEGTILVEPVDGDMALYIDQLERLRALGAKTVLPAHGSAIDDPDALFERYVRHRRMREGRVLRALSRLGEHGATAAELVPDAYDDTPKAAWAIAAMSVAAHLVKLAREGLAHKTDERYVATGTGS